MLNSNRRLLFQQTSPSMCASLCGNSPANFILVTKPLLISVTHTRNALFLMPAI
jgi:hypothetical protein